MADALGIDPDVRTIMFDGFWYPNPLSFATSPTEEMARRRQRTVTGQIHGDLNGNNILVSKFASPNPSYFLIDFEFYEQGQELFYDHAYAELSHLLLMRARSDSANWRSLLYELRSHIRPEDGSRLRGDDLGLVEVVRSIRGEVTSWIDRHESDRLSSLECQYLLARVAVGLNFAHKRIDDKLRRMSFVYAAANLKDYLAFVRAKWPKHGPPIDLETQSPAAETSSQPVSQGGPAPVADNPPALPDRPAIAVLAFENLSGDPSKDFVSDGLSHEIMLALSKIDWLMVIGRGSTFRYKDTDADLSKISHDLGVHYVVEGRVRFAGERIRVSVQLVNALNSHHLWSERYDRQFDDIFELEEEIAKSIAANVDSTLRVEERSRAGKLGSRASTWLGYQYALGRFFADPLGGMDAAFSELRDLTEREPAFADAHALLAVFETRKILTLDSGDPVKDLDQARGHAVTATQLDHHSSMAKVGAEPCVTAGRTVRGRRRTGPARYH